MARYFIELAYKGTNFHGWQIQPNGISIQEILEKTLSQIFSTEIKVIGAGRTDSGVHAAYMVAHFDTPQPIRNCDYLTLGLNKMLPQDIVIIAITEVAENAHSRFFATSRIYEYHIAFEKNPFLFDYVYTKRHHQELDIDAMNEAAKILFSYSDFTSFCKIPSDNKTNICTIKQSFWEMRGDKLVYVIEANRFIRNMVRAIVGTLLDVGRKKISIQEFIMIIESKDRAKASTSAPAKGLFLIDVQYPEDVFIPSPRKNYLFPLNI